MHLCHCLKLYIIANAKSGLEYRIRINFCGVTNAKQAFGFIWLVWEDVCSVYTACKSLHAIIPAAFDPNGYKKL